MKFWITQHSKDRFRERILNGQNTVDNLNVHMINILRTGTNITSQVYDECPRYILYLYEKYKELGIAIIRAQNILFITKKRKGTYNLYDVLTCYYNTDNYLRQFKNTALTRDQIFMKIKEIKRKL